MTELHYSSLTHLYLRLAPIVYESEGERLAQKLWEETMNEFAFAKAADIVHSLSR